MALSCKSCLSKLLLEFAYGAVVQKLCCEAISQALVWDCRAKAALQSYVSIFSIELLGKRLNADQFLKLLH